MKRTHVSSLYGCSARFIVPLAMLCISACAAISRADDAAEPGSADAAQLSYTATQAEHGRALFIEHCVLCHGINLNDGQFGAPLKGSYFRGRWRDKTAAELFAITVATMPPSQPNLLPYEDYADLMAFVLKGNGVAASDTALPADIAALNAIRFTW